MGAKWSDLNEKVRFGIGGAVIGALTGNFGDVCWNMLIIGDCFERGSMASYIGSAFLGAGAGAFFGPDIFRFIRSKKGD